MTTPHINAPEGAFAELCLLPGDPLRAKFIAEQFLENAQCVTDVRNMLGFTGTYKGQPVSVMGTGMGIPSCSIYATELIRHYGVSKLVRVGSCGAVMPDIQLHDIILAQGACTDSGVNRQRFNNFDFAAIADFELLRQVVSHAESTSIDVRVGNVFSADLFYQADPALRQRFQQMGILGVEMEAAGLYGVAAEHGVAALTVLTVSDHIVRGEALSSDERQLGFHAMVELALDALI
ncbi:purine-nucleoside phosphorylase [Pseudidiomarina andamanensis]|jgi:purine-nucleoside phosphorylase|uniref:Purine nucleoside phosphorylase DeoD-type n=1 Tax=Pseudidiomarina andamanensis TaxID=1940690 RepID=A0AA92ES57_9GAMM|nr:purine-nucleoside phosphorylase [Pseudidiomarina andamanensis]MDS0219666.1 purine-nucleoside phosphorylase [Pseudidiomarina andamanensis]QGT95712.1 purine-nucleoside phosphorylase [Pseudidiomarina andamanensis]